MSFSPIEPNDIMPAPILTVTPFDCYIVAFQDHDNKFVYYCSNDKWEMDVYQATHYDSYDEAKKASIRKQSSLRFGLFVMKTPIAEALGHMMDDLVDELTSI